MTRCILASLLSVFSVGPASSQTKEIQDEIERKLAKARAANRTEEHIEIFRRLLNRGLIGSYDHASIAPVYWQLSHHGYDLPSTATMTYYTQSSYIDPATNKPIYYYEPKTASASIYPAPPIGAYSATPSVKYDLGFPASNYVPSRPSDSVHAGLGKLPPPTLAEGVYLPGRGVVYTATLPVPPKNPMATTDKPADKPVSAWERERRHLRGENEEKPTKPVAGPPSVSETILHLLAENGKHFTELKPDEQVTIAVVFRPGKLFADQQCTQCHQVGVDMSRNASSGSATTSGSMGSSTSTGTSGKEDPNKPAESVVTLFRNDMALGDLHLKQGKAREAALVYRQLLKNCADLLASLEKQPPDTTRSERLHVIMVTAEVYAKLAQAQFAAGDKEEALKSLQAGADLSRKIEKFIAEPKTEKNTAPPPNPVPARLVISVPKKVLDMVADGKISFEQFRGTATIEYTGAEKETGTKP